jgi:hypothetical protein
MFRAHNGGTYLIARLHSEGPMVLERRLLGGAFTSITPLLRIRVP